jgi:hypothetical protein
MHTENFYIYSIIRPYRIYRNSQCEERKQGRRPYVHVCTRIEAAEYSACAQKYIYAEKYLVYVFYW